VSLPPDRYRRTRLAYHAAQARRRVASARAARPCPVPRRLLLERTELRRRHLEEVRRAWRRLGYRIAEEAARRAGRELLDRLTA